MSFKRPEEKDEIRSLIKRAWLNSDEESVMMTVKIKDDTFELPIGLISFSVIEQLLLWITKNDDKIVLNLDVIEDYESAFQVITGGRLPLSSIIKQSQMFTLMDFYTNIKSRCNIKNCITKGSVIDKCYKLLRFRHWKRLFCKYSDLTEEEKETLMDYYNEPFDYPLWHLDTPVYNLCVYQKDYYDNGMLISEMVRELKATDILRSREYYHYNKFDCEEVNGMKFILYGVFSNMLLDEFAIKSWFSRNHLPRHIIDVRDFMNVCADIRFVLPVPLRRPQSYRRPLNPLLRVEQRLKEFTGNIFEPTETTKHFLDLFWKVAVVTGSIIPYCLQYDIPNETLYLDSDIDIAVDPDLCLEILGIDIKDSIQAFVEWFYENIVSHKSGSYKIKPTSTLYKQRIQGNKDQRPIEIFRQKVGCIYNFHVACVRGYYDGTTWYLLPSAWYALIKGVSIDFRYSKSEKTAIDIIKKYRERGYIVCLNNIEIEQYFISTGCSEEEYFDRKKNENSQEEY